MYDIDGLTILHDGWSSWDAGTSSQHVHIPGWNPQRGWQFGFAASSWQQADFHWMDNLMIWSTWLVRGPAPYDLTVTLNGQQFVSAFTNITYLAAPAISRLMPALGPAADLTEEGSWRAPLPTRTIEQRAAGRVGVPGSRLLFTSEKGEQARRR